MSRALLRGWVLFLSPAPIIIKRMENKMKKHKYSDYENYILTADKWG